MAQQSYLGEIRHFAFDFAPKQWAQCNGQLIAINQNQALYGVIGTTFGGNGTTNFALPNLQGTVSVSAGAMPNGPTYAYGQTGGAASVQLGVSQMPTHSHSANGSSAPVSTGVPGSGVLPGAYSSPTEYSDSGSSVAAMASQTVGSNVGGQGHENQQPFLVLNICICVQGPYPPHN